MKNNEHNKEKDNKEYRALVILNNLFTDTYKLVKKDERPDLKDETLNIGIEVVCSFNDFIKEAINCFKNGKMKFNAYGEPKVKYKNGIEKVYQNQAISFFSWEDYHVYIDCLKNKLEKLKDYVKIKNYKRYDLYIQAYALIDSEDVDDCLRALIKTQKDFKNKFQYVYIAFEHKIYRFDLLNEQVEIRIISDDLFKNLNTLVKKEIELDELTKI
ncbi:MAG: hypothetical protein MJ066_01850 [Clostridia bacterium]|nr:hypothetical protein [Clostridia bacterium]